MIYLEAAGIILHLSYATMARGVFCFVLFCLPLRVSPGLNINVPSANS